MIYLSKMSKWEKWDRVVQFRLNSVLHSFRSITSGLRRPSSFACADGRETQKETFFLGRACAYSFFHALTLGALAMITPQQSETQAVAHRWPHAQDGRCCLASLRSSRQANPFCHPTTTRLNHRFSKCSVRSPRAPREKPRGSASSRGFFVFICRNL